MLNISAHSPTVLQSHANVKQFSERLEQNKQLEENDPKDVDNTKPEKESSQEKSEQSQLQSLKSRDREVRAHELAHASVGGQYASGATFTYEKGSDGVLYAVAGEVAINTSTIQGDPRATLEKAQVIQRAALAPADPSSQDRSIAAAAAAMAQKARVEIIKLNEVERYKQPNAQEANPEDNSIDVFA